MKKEIPKCIGVIMDGNRRWAKKKEVATFKGHNEGYKRLKDLISWTNELKIQNVIIYAFSTENWKRSEIEIKYLFKIFRKLIFKELDFLKKENAKVKFVGQIDRFPKDIQKGILKIEKETEKNKGINIFLALSYGGRAEIIDAVSKALKEAKSKNIKITEKSFKKYFWTKDMPDPEIIIRTGGEMRLSNFLLWQAAYSELFFTKTFWPDFSKKEFNNIILEFGEREKRCGK